MARKRRRPPLVRTVGTPPSVQAKVEAIMRLSREIERVAAHVGVETVRSHDRRTVLALERKRHRRGELLDAIREQDERVYVTLVQQLKR